jgi:hypothetical protein
MINLTDPNANRPVIDIAHQIRAESVQLLHPLFVNSEALKAHALLLKNTLGREMNYWHSADIPCTTPRDYELVMSTLKQLQETSSIPVEVFPKLGAEQLRAYYAQDVAFSKLHRGACQAMWYTATILPNGEVESCPDYVVGNCRTSDFRDLWNNSAMKELRKRIRHRNFFTVCRACCYFYQR